MTSTRWPASEMHALSNFLESERTGKRKSGFFSSSVLLVEGQIDLQHVNSGLTEYTDIPPSGVFLDELADFVFAQSSEFSDTRDLELRITEADLWVESTT